MQQEETGVSGAGPLRLLCRRGPVERLAGCDAATDHHTETSSTPRLRSTWTSMRFVSLLSPYISRSLHRRSPVSTPHSPLSRPTCLSASHHSRVYYRVGIGGVGGPVMRFGGGPTDDIIPIGLPQRQWHHGMATWLIGSKRESLTELSGSTTILLTL